MSKLFDLEKNAILGVTAVVVVVWYIFQYVFGWTMNASTVVELEKELMQVTGFIFAFAGVIYASVFSEIRLNEPKTKRILAVHLRMGAIGAFSYLFVALLSSSWTFVISSNLKPDFQYSVAAAFVIPLALIAGAFALVLVGMWRLTITELKA